MALMRRLAVLLLCMAFVFGCQERDRPKELVCAGQVRFGEEVITDKFVLRVDGDAIEIRGETGTLSTFDGAMYRVCAKSRDEIEFEYAATGQSGGSNLSRSGALQMVTGDLKIQRFDMGKPFAGSYECKRKSRVLN